MNWFEVDDLASPRPNPRIEPILRAVLDAGGTPLRPGELLAEAVRQTGLTDFGGEEFRRPLEILCTALRTEAGLSPVGEVSLAAGLVQLLGNRLLVEDLFARHPEIAAVPVDRPIVIAGLPRTGTTHLHRLLAAAPGVRTVPYWESAEPVLATPVHPDPRPERAHRALEFVDLALPHLKRMHELDAREAEEDIRLLAIAFSSTYFECQVPVPAYRDWYLGTDQKPAYAFLRRVLQALTWLRGGGRWVLKAPQHLEQLPALCSVFPDATVVFTHRDPATAVASLSTMAAYSARMIQRVVDVPAIASYWADRIEHLIGRFLADHAAVPAECSVHVPFTEIVTDPLGVAERVLAAAGVPYTAEAKAALDDYVRGHPRDRHGRMRYDTDVLGLTGRRPSAALTAYRARFGEE
ncbi:sulfotransferase [Amycolatopsis sp. A133]|uniref:sulfotransferase family protein n=1 Tax=Amycolatopsis sp. A133 TaxID=3064472 RepID=UPI0027EDA019|nr:sulfotransferase [Amycolatopsis sp. A133]MDQ7803493.1 sulfotransferase [Amycolatopsis sp. A133]